MLILVLSLIKFAIIFGLKEGFDGFFNDYTVILNRFSLLHYYFNIFETLIIFNDDEIKNKLKIVMDNITENYEEEENKYTKILLNNIHKYQETKLLFNLLKETKNNSTEIIKEKICEKEKECINYLDSKYNIFDSGIDFSYKSCISKLKSLYNDYQKLKNNTDIEEIKSKIINSNQNLFNHISIGISNLVIYVKFKIYNTFQNDLISFIFIFDTILNYLNISFIIFSIMTILFVNIFTFITISNFTRPLKDSTYRLNCSFYYIKKYNPLNFRQFDSLS